MKVSLKGRYKLFGRNDEEFYAHLTQDNTCSIISIKDWHVNKITISEEEFGEMFVNLM